MVRWGDSVKQGNRWWEFYAVRYAQGAVAGAIILHILIEKSQLNEVMPFLEKFSESNVYLYLLLLLICGLAYSYIASGPILIMHAARGLTLNNEFNDKPLAGWGKRSVLLSIFYIVLVSFFYICASGNILLLSPYAVAVSFQFVLLYQILFGRNTRETVKRYYVALLKKRKELEESEYIESYRHLREHGNSFCIVMFQIFFALAIWEIANSRSLTFLVILFLFWVFPPSFIWFFGNVLENNLLTLSRKDLLPDRESNDNKEVEESPMNNNTGADSTKKERGFIFYFMGKLDGEDEERLMSNNSADSTKKGRGFFSYLIEKLDGDVLVFFFSLVFSCVLLLIMIIAMTVIVVSKNSFDKESSAMMFLLTPWSAIIPVVAACGFFGIRSLFSCCNKHVAIKRHKQS